ncbi:MAG: hypothetical protein A2X02_05405 [Bacteroidetes bacterium GWF2_29_10]|nr:MAG: hypothetical protein A2X02_05405 [Bacteroidetes bacterium GWF2_29_10]
MKKTTFIILFTVLYILSYAQITTTKIAPKAEQIDNTPYDSTKNFLGENVYKYIGQTLYLKGKAEILRKYGYSNFILNYKEDKRKLSNTYKVKPLLEGDRYIKNDIGGGTSHYDSIVGKYFNILEVIKHPEANSDKFLYGNVFYLKLQEKISKDIVYFEYNSKYESQFEFIVVGFFEKQKSINVGQEFIFANKNIKYRFPGDANPKLSLDINTGKELTIITGDKWKCVDLTIEEENYTFSLIVQNSLGETTTIDYDNIYGRFSKGRAYTILEADNYKKIFGNENFNTILQNNIKIGMTREMCKLSWGEPNKINKTITDKKKSEQWVYTDNYLYFEDDILTAMQ